MTKKNNKLINIMEQKVFYFQRLQFFVPMTKKDQKELSNIINKINDFIDHLERI